MCYQVEDETTVNDNFSVTVPAAVREQAAIEAGDKLRWQVEADGSVRVTVLQQRFGAFSELEPVDIGEETDVATDHDLIAGGF